MGAAGHRLVPHSADVILEAWADSRAGCLEQAVLALLEAFVDAAGAPVEDRVSVELDAASEEDLLVALLEEVLFQVDARGAVPVVVHLDLAGEGNLTGFLDTVSAGEVELTGAIPKGVSRSLLEIAPEDGQWRCRVLVDV